MGLVPWYNTRVDTTSWTILGCDLIFSATKQEECKHRAMRLWRYVSSVGHALPITCKPSGTFFFQPGPKILAFWETAAESRFENKLLEEF